MKKGAPADVVAGREKHGHDHVSAGVARISNSHRRTLKLLAPAYSASQPGNSVKMLLERYAGWIPGGDQGNARALLVAAMTGDPEGIRPNGHFRGATRNRKAQANRRLAWACVW
jgi:hypothetical protein